MKGLTSLPALAGIFLFIFTSVSYADTLIYGNSNLTYSGFNPASYTEFIDYGTSSGGMLSKFTFDYWTESTSTGTVWISFYRYTDYSDPGYLIKTFALTNVPSTGGYIDTYEYIIPEQDRFELPSGDFGYSYEMSRSTTYIATASGGQGNEDYFWIYDDIWNDFVRTYFDGIHSGFSMQVYTAPPIDEVTCDISGYKFDDVDADGIWDAGEPPLSGWLVYLDTNNNDQYDTAAEPNTVTDQSGMYLFEYIDAPATYTIREVMQNGWTQTLPGNPNYEYTIATEPNNVYGPYSFGNTEQLVSEITVSGYIKEGTVPIEGAYVEAYENGDIPTGLADTTDSQGYYEIQLPTPWTGNLLVQKKGYLFDATTSYSNHTTDITENINCAFLYGGGDGSSSAPFEIWTAEQMNNIGSNPFDWDQHFILMEDIDLGVYTGINYNIIGVDENNSFSGVFMGNNHSIANFNYSTTANVDNIGLFGIVKDEFAEIRDLTLNAPDIDAPNAKCIGAIVGNLVYGDITNCHVTGGSLRAYWFIGGIAGNTENFYTIPEKGGTIINCSANCNVEGGYSVQTFAGGLVGYHSGLIVNSSSSGNIQGYRSVGGLVGHAHQPTGPSESGYIYNSYATGQVTGTDSVGGLVGSNSYAKITNCYSAGRVTGSTMVGGLCGDNTIAPPVTGEFIGCFWNEDASNQTTSAGGTGLSSTDMQTKQTFLNAGWDFIDETVNGTDNIWQMCPDGMGHPRLAYETIICGKYGGGDGTEETPYLIATAEHLQQLGATPEDWADGIYFSVVADIDMSAYTGTSFNIIGTDTSNAFHGYIAGNNHTISDFTYSTTAAASYIGLFGCFNGRLTDLMMTNVLIDVPNADYVGGITGYLGAWILRCGVESGDITGGDQVGGITGHINLLGSRAPVIYNSYSNCMISANDYVGGIAGSSRGVRIVGCYSTSPISGSNAVGGILGQSQYTNSSIDYCYAAGLISAVYNKGGLVGESSCRTIKSFWDQQTTNCTYSGGGEPKTTTQMKITDTFAGWGCSGVWTINEGIDYPRLVFENKPGTLLPVPTYGGGSGTQEDPYLIYTAGQFNDIGKYECHNASYFNLMADIELDPVTPNNFVPVGYLEGFEGSFDGNYHMISNPNLVQVDPSRGAIGLFSQIGAWNTAGEIKNLGVLNPNIASAGDAVGGLCGYVGMGAIQNCFVQGGSIEGVDGVGGLAGMIARDTGLIQNCYTNTSVSGQAEVAGLAGSCYDGTIESCYASGPVVGVSDTGGLVGYYSVGQINNSCYDQDTAGQTDGQGVALSTAQMQTLGSYTNWDFETVWRICDGMNYPRLQWEPKPVGDFVCPEGVELYDLVILYDEWLAKALSLSADMAPEGGDGKVNLTDWAHLANAWMSSTGQAGWDADCDIAPETPDGQINELDLSEFADQWLYRSARFADIAPAQAPDGRVDLLDYSLFSENWLIGVD